MIDQAVQSVDGANLETVLREQLGRGDAVADSAAPVLRYLLLAEDSSAFSDDILARVRGMLADLAGGLFDAVADPAGTQERPMHAPNEIDALARALLENPALLTHLHALALEWQLTERLQARLALDPVVSPLLQALVSAEHGAARNLAMEFVAAQVRWCQSQRRMTLPLAELPAELFEVVLVILRAHLADGSEPAEAGLRERYDEAGSRLGLAFQLVEGLGEEAQTALSVSHAGAALFLTALALGSGQTRDAVVLSTHEAQIARLALALRSAGLGSEEVEWQLLVLHPEITPPSGFDRLDADIATAVLSSGRPPC